MPKKLQKSLQGYLSKIKNPHPQIQSSFSSLSSSSKKWIISACKYPKTPSFAIHRRNQAHRHDDAATLSDIDRFLFDNFKSLYLRDDGDSLNNNPKSFGENHEAPRLDPILFESPRFLHDPPPDLCGSNRFFVSLGSSGSLVEDALTTTSDEAGSSSSSTTETLLHNSIAVLTYSQSPYEDFRRSMQEMVEARFRNHERVDWDFMEDLLFSYLNLNDNKSYKFILSAFVDLIVVLRSQSWERGPAKPRSVPTVRIGREIRRKKTKEATLESMEKKNMGGVEVRENPRV